MRAGESRLTEERKYEKRQAIGRMETSTDSRPSLHTYTRSN